MDRTLDVLFGSEQELERTREQLASGSDEDPVAALALRLKLGEAPERSVLAEKAVHDTLLKTLVGSPDELERLVSESTASADPTWRETLLGPTASTAARLARPQRHSNSLEPERADGEPAAHEPPDDEVRREWEGGSQSWIYRGGKLVASRTEYATPYGLTVEFFDAAGDEISKGKYDALAA